jgi:streptogramin lyase
MIAFDIIIDPKEASTMLPRSVLAPLVRGSWENGEANEGCQSRPTHRHAGRTRTRAWFRLETLEDRSLLSAISSITEFPVSGVTGASPQSVVSGPDGNLWFTEAGANAIGVINPMTHAVSSFAIPTSGSAPGGIAAGPDGNLWFTEGASHQVGDINPTTHSISLYTVPNGIGRPWCITAGPDGNLWFDIYEAEPETVGEINPTTHAISEFTVPPGGGAIPGGIIAGPDGNIWFIWGEEVAEINPTSHAYSVSHLPSPGAGPLTPGITTGPDGNVWFTLGSPSGGTTIGMINPTSHAITEFSVGLGGCGITAGPDGNLWFTTTSGQIGQINPTTDAITEYRIPYGNSSARGITTGPDGNLWFEDNGTSAIGAVTLSSSQFVVTTQPPTSVMAGTGFGLSVTAEDSSGNPITSFDGTVTVGLDTNPGGATLGGTLTATASNGVASFSGLTLNEAAAGYTLNASGGGYGWGVTNAITVTPAAASQLVITTEPPATVKLSGPFGLQASIEDAYGNVVTTATNTVSVAFANNPTGATLGGTLSVAASQGVATFSNLTINKLGNGYTLAVSSTGLTGATSTAINVTKKGTSSVGSPPANGSAVDTELGPLVLDSSDLWDAVGLKKRARTM